MHLLEIVSALKFLQSNGHFKGYETVFGLSTAGAKVQMSPIGPLHDLVTWHGIHWDANYAVGLSKQGKLGWTGTISFALEVPLRDLRPSVIYSVLFDRVVQRASLESSHRMIIRVHFTMSMRPNNN